MGIFSAIADLFFPPKCIFCGGTLSASERSERICRRCRRELPYNEELIPPSGELSRVCAPLVYAGHVRDALHRYKFSSRSDYSAPLAKLLASEVKRRFGEEFDTVTWAPVSDERRRSRGYDQSMLLAMAAALELSSVAVCTLEKVRDNTPNSTLGAAERAANVQNAYRVTAPELVEGKRVLIIDDIYTTGATMRECARVLVEAGAKQVLGAAVARTAHGEL